MTGATARQLPVAPWLRGYERAWLAKDLVGGIAAGAVVIPQAMAYATIAGLPAEVGLYTCMVPMAVYALLGGSRTLSVSTTSTIAVLTGSTLVAAGIAAGSDDPARAVATLTLLVGCILLAARLLRLGPLIDNISNATLTGVKFGVGLTVAAGQLPALLGVPGDPSADSFVGYLRAVGGQLDEVSWVTVAFSAGTLGVLFAINRLLPQVPAPLVAVAAGIGMVAFASIDEHGIALIDPVPSGLPLPVAPDPSLAVSLLPGALAIAIMVFLEAIAVARLVRRPSEPAVDNDQELTANAAACIAGAFFRAMPSAGGFSQTAINQRAGARTQLSELVTVTLAVGCALFLGGLLSNLPEATLACMVIVAVLGLIKPAELVRFWRFSRIEFWVAVATALCGLALGLLPAVFVGVGLTLLLVLVELDRIGLTELEPTEGDRDVEPAGPHTQPVPGLLVLRFDGPVYTANVRGVNRKLLASVDEHPGTEVVVLDATVLAMLSLTAVDELAELERALAERGATPWIAAIPPGTLEAARRLPRWDELERAGRLHPTALAAVHAFRERSTTG